MTKQRSKPGPESAKSRRNLLDTKLPFITAENLQKFIFPRQWLAIDLVNFLQLEHLEVTEKLPKEFWKKHKLCPQHTLIS